MKKITLIAAAFAMAFGITSCGDDNNGGINLDEVVLDGFYVYGEATGSDKVNSVNAMAAGFNEVEKAARSGMYEKYIYLQGGKDFALIENSAGNKKFYGANLKEVNYGFGTETEPGKNFADNPNMMILQGKLIIGESAPAMQVKETGLYHIVLDNNSKGDLGKDGAQIIIQKAEWGVRGGMNGWGYTAGETTVNADGTIEYVWRDQELSSNGEFKFASCHGWKINLDENGVVKAEVSFGVEDGKLALTNSNIAVEKAGLYDITLTYSPKAGALADSFSYTVTLTKESTLPETCYMIGQTFGGWSWESDALVTLIPAHSEPGAFWTIRYIKAGDPFKFSPEKAWGKDFTGLGTDSGYAVADGNCSVAEDGLYMIDIDFKNGVLNIAPAEVYGMGDVFGGWDEGANPYTITEVASVVAANDGNLRTYAKSALPAAAGNWWHREFVIVDGKIAYRADGGDPAAVAVKAGQTITFDFNAGTGSIE